MNKKILIIAGEASGDRLAAHALRAAQEIASERGAVLDIYGIGGSECASLGAKLYYTDKDVSVIGFAEVVKRYLFFRKVFRRMISLLDDPLTKPDVVFLIDYPGFNLRFAKEAKKRNIKVIYYVSPQVWAWKEGRIESIIENTDELLVIFPFEEKLYKEKGHHNVKFVGHPLLELIEEEEKSFIGREAFATKHRLDAKKGWLLIFPGSRAEEVSRHLSIMMAAAEKFDNANRYEKIIVKASGVTISEGNTKVFDGSSKEIHELMSHGSLGILKSGTTTLEAGLMGLPGVICYKISSITYLIAKNLIKLPYIGLINIVLGKQLYPELIQDDFTSDSIAEELRSVLGNKSIFTEELRNLRSLLRATSGSTARRVVNELLAD